MHRAERLVITDLRLIQRSKRCCRFIIWSFYVFKMHVFRIFFPSSLFHFDFIIPQALHLTLAIIARVAADKPDLNPLCPPHP